MKKYKVTFFMRVKKAERLGFFLRKKYLIYIRMRAHNHSFVVGLRLLLV